MATAKALPEYDIDFQALATRYFEIRQEERDVCDARQGSGQRRIVPRTMIPVPDFRDITLNVYDEEWVDRSNILGASSSTFSEATTTLNVEGDSRASGSGFVNTIQDASGLSRVKITRGLCTDIGQTLFLPLPEDPEFLREVLGEDELEIDPSRPEGKEEDKTKVKAHFKWRRLSAHGATVDVTRSRQHYEGRFSCLVYPSGSIMLQRDSANISGTNPDMKVVIQKLKNSRNLDDQGLVKNFVLVELPKRNRTINVYCWRFEGYYEFRSVPEISYAAPVDGDDDSDY